MPNQFSIVKKLQSEGQQIPPYLEEACRNAQIRKKTRSDKGKKHKTHVVHDENYIPTYDEVRQSNYELFDKNQKDLENTYLEVCKWEAWELTKLKRKIIAKQKHARHERIRKAKKRVEAAQEGGTFDKLSRIKRALKNLEMRLSIIPEDMLCPNCGKYWPKSKQWVVDLSNKTVVCKSCRFNHLLRLNLCTHSVDT